MTDIHHISDAQRQLRELKYDYEKELADSLRQSGQQRDALLGVGMNALKYWNESQRAKTKELLSMTDDADNFLFKPSPEHAGRGAFKRFFTPAKGRVEETLKATEYLPKNPDLDKALNTPTTFGGTVEKTGSDIAKTSEKTFGSTLGKIGAGAGAIYGAATLAQNWDKKDRYGNPVLSQVDKTLGTISTGLSAASIFFPPLGIWAAGTSLLDALWN